MQHFRIFLADDHAVVRAGVKALVERQPDMTVVGEAADGRTAVEEVAACEPDVVVMDLSMPELNGVRATCDILRQSPSTKIVVLSVHEEMSYLRELLAAGASGYVLKRSAPDALIQALRAVTSDGVYLDPALGDKVANRLIRTRRGADASPGDALSDRETDVLQRIAQGYSNKEIATQLDISIRTVETYRARAMEKLGLNNRAALVRYAVQRGWLQQL
ncbi:MAG: response regulator transcription factor [Nannocystaceae bacterium]